MALGEKFLRATSIVLFIFIFSFFFTSSLIEAKTSQKTSQATTTIPTKKWAVIDGFRSAKFGMNQKQVLRAINKDFKISSSKAKKRVNSIEKTSIIDIEVPELLGSGGTALISYIFGHQSKKLSHVNIIWGLGISKKVDGQGVVDAANLLRSHFVKKRYKDEGLVVNGQLNETTILVFRGSDRKGRMALLALTTPKPLKNETLKDSAKKVSLKLSYILNPTKPDILTIKDGDF
jgi:hypothetical protein